VSERSTDATDKKPRLKATVKLAAMAKTSASYEYASSRERSVPRAIGPAKAGNRRTGCILDVETIDLDHGKNEIIEGGMAKLNRGLQELVTSFEEPCGPTRRKLPPDQDRR
jgi:hypothetical protein